MWAAENHSPPSGMLTYISWIHGKRNVDVNQAVQPAHVTSRDSRLAIAQKLYAHPLYAVWLSRYRCVTW